MARERKDGETPEEYLKKCDKLWKKIDEGLEGWKGDEEWRNLIVVKDVTIGICLKRNVGIFGRVRKNAQWTQTDKHCQFR